MTGVRQKQKLERLHNKKRGERIQNKERFKKKDFFYERPHPPAPDSHPVW